MSYALGILTGLIFAKLTPYLLFRISLIVGNYIADIDPSYRKTNEALNDRKNNL